MDEDGDAARRLARINVDSYASHPICAPMVAAAGLEVDRDAVVAAMMKDGPGAIADATSDALIEAFAIAGTPDEAREQLAAYEAVLDHVVLHTPYVPPISAEESHRAFHNIASTFAPGV